ncbi:MAG: hypothetical protein AAF242_00885 [Bacteroidota bacterium]
MVKILLIVVIVYFYFRFVLMRPAINDKKQTYQQPFNHQNQAKPKAEPEPTPQDGEYLDYEEVD